MLTIWDAYNEIANFLRQSHRTIEVCVRKLSYRLRGKKLVTYVVPVAVDFSSNFCVVFLPFYRN